MKKEKLEEQKMFKNKKQKKTGKNEKRKIEKKKC